jgi:hypothetical protein
MPSEMLLHIPVPIIDQEHRAPVKPKPVEGQHDRREVVQFLKQVGDVVDEQLLAVVEESAEDAGEVGGADLPAAILVLGDEGLGGVVPHLGERVSVDWNAMQRMRFRAAHCRGMMNGNGTNGRGEQDKGGQDDANAETDE